MSGSEWLITTLLRSTVWLSISTVLAWAVLRILKVRSPRCHRVTWGLVLAQGALTLLIPLRAAWEIPWRGPGSGGGGLWAGELPSLPPAEARSVPAPPVPDSPATTAPPKARRVGGTVLAGVWLGGIAGLLCASLAGSAALHLRLRCAPLAPLPRQREWLRLLRSAGIARRVPLVLHTTLGPLLWLGLRGYRVVVPEHRWREFTGRQRDAILRHELAHYRRNDIIKSLVVRLLAVFHWFNPCAWWAVRKFEEGCEWSCDAALRSDPRSATEFARALLSLAHPRTPLGARAARGGSLTRRVRRLLSSSPCEDSVMKKFVLASLLTGLLAGGFVKLKLVAQERAEPAAASVITAAQLADFTQRLAINEDPQLREFQRLAGTAEGRIALQDRASKAVAALRAAARDEALPTYFRTHFAESTEGQLTLRDDARQYREQFLQQFQTYTEDLAAIAPALRSAGEKISGDSEADQLARRFLTHEAAALILYTKELRLQLRPDAEAIARQFGQLFAAAPQGGYMIRQGRRAEAEAIGKVARSLADASELLQKELPTWARELADKDPFHKQLKQACGEPLFAAFIISLMPEKAQDSPAQRISKFFRGLEELSTDTGMGIVLQGEKVDEIKNALETYQAKQRIAKVLREPLRAFAQQLSVDDPLHQTWRKLLQTDVALLKVCDEVRAGANPAETVEGLLRQVLQDDGQGGLRVAEDQRENFSQAVQELFRNYREMRRIGARLKERAEHVRDEELRTALSSQVGQLIALLSIKQKLESQQFDGFAAWVEHHFDRVGEKLVAKPTTREELAEVTALAKQLRRELEKNNDF